MTEGVNNKKKREKKTKITEENIDRVQKVFKDAYKKNFTLGKAKEILKDPLDEKKNLSQKLISKILHKELDYSYRNVETK